LCMSGNMRTFAAHKNGIGLAVEQMTL